MPLCISRLKNLHLLPTYSIHDLMMPQLLFPRARPACEVTDQNDTFGGATEFEIDLRVFRDEARLTVFSGIAVCERENDYWR